MLGHRPLVVEDYLTILKRRWWIVVLPLLLLPILGYSFSYTIPPQYLSQTLVLIDSPKVPDNYVKPVVSSDLDSRLASMKEQILSRSHLQPIIERYNLYTTQHMDMDDRIDLVRRNIDIKPIHSEIAHSGGLPGFFISFKADDAHTAQLVCSDITSLFLNENLKLREASAEGTTDFLNEQLSNAKRSLDEQDAKLAAFQEKYMGRLPGDETTNSGMLSSLGTQLEAANQSLARMEQDRTYQQSMLAQQQAVSAPIAVSPSGTVTVAPGPVQEANQTELQTLMGQEAELTSHYTSDYPDVIAVRRKIADLKRRMSQQAAAPAVAAASPSSAPAPSRFDSPAVIQLKAQLRAADVGIAEKRKEQAMLQGNLRSYEERIQSSPAIEEQYKQLTRDYNTAQTFYDDLLGKKNQSKMATDLEKRQQGEQFRVMDEANLPDAPFSPKRSVFLMSGAAVGLALGLALVGLLEYRDTTLRSERDIWAFTNLPTLGVLGYTELLDNGSRSGWRRFFRFLPKRSTKQGVAAQA